MCAIGSAVIQHHPSLPENVKRAAEHILWWTAPPSLFQSQKLLLYSAWNKSMLIILVIAPHRTQKPFSYSWTWFTKLPGLCASKHPFSWNRYTESLHKLSLSSAVYFLANSCSRTVEAASSDSVIEYTWNILELLSSNFKWL